MTNPTPVPTRDLAERESRIVETEGGGRQEVWALPADSASLERLIRMLFDGFWDQMWFGVLIEGAAWEVAAPNAPKDITMMGGYVTVDFGRWHFHLCIGEHTASGPELGRIRRASRAEAYRSLGSKGAPTSWGVRLFNGRDEQMMTVMLPSPFLTPTQQLEDVPRWDRLAAWDRVRSDFLGLDPDPIDRSGSGFRHG